MDIRQSAHYATYMRSIGWRIKTVGCWNAFIKPLPVIGPYIKIQRILNPIPEKAIAHLAQNVRARHVIIEPDRNAQYQIENTKYRLLNDPFLPTKTIHIDLTPPEKDIFNSFSSAKRRAVRRAKRHNVLIFQSRDIDQFARLKAKGVFPVGFLVRSDIRKLWHAFSPNHAIILFAIRENTHVLAGVLMLMHRTTAYYWHAVSTRKGKECFAPSLLVWEAIKHAKRHGCIVFDFEGIYDNRFPKTFKNWKGFTRFKKGFGGDEIVYPRPIQLFSR